MIPTHELPLDDRPGSVWVMSAPERQRALRRALRSADSLGTRFHVRMGIKTGRNGVLVRKRGDSTSADESELWRPVLRGRDIASGHDIAVEEAFFAHDDRSGDVLRLTAKELPRAIQRASTTLKNRTDLRGRDEWWRVFRVYPEALGWRVAWADIAQVFQPIILPPVSAGGPLLLNTCYFIGVHSAEAASALQAWLSSTPIGELATAMAEPALSGYFRYQSHVVERLPLPDEVLDCGSQWGDVVHRGGIDGVREKDSLARELLSRDEPSFALRQRDLR